jgi:hypothetical protein
MNYIGYLLLIILIIDAVLKLVKVMSREVGNYCEKLSQELSTILGPFKK